mmetsp:Transcript_31282/g.36096  ORF Transcript_31282/g.36096 Transcript_31282/m.36096 type:complete len:86 (+) Transcript_31282:673-930(+)
MNHSFLKDLLRMHASLFAVGAFSSSFSNNDACALRINFLFLYSTPNCPISITIYIFVHIVLNTSCFRRVSKKLSSLDGRGNTDFS